MTKLEARNRKFLGDLFAGPFRGHGIIVIPEYPDHNLGDFSASRKPVKQWLPWIVAAYHARVKSMELFEDDSVPYACLATHTGVFAAAFGCKVHVYREQVPACALPCVATAKEADRLPEPTRYGVALERVLELAHLARAALGPEVPISVPDIQSPFDIAALIWKKESMLMAMYDEPESVKRLVDKCHRLLTRFLQEFRRDFPECNFIHCPTAWAPPALGCSLSEDEAGSMSVAMFEEFCLPSLVDLSRSFDGLFMHCCAAADHQYASFRKIPDLRGLNRVFQAPGPLPAIRAFAGRTVLMQAWMSADQYIDMVDNAQPGSRFLFNLLQQPPDDLRRSYDRLRARCPRRDS